MNLADRCVDLVNKGYDYGYLFRLRRRAKKTREKCGHGGRGRGDLILSGDKTMPTCILEAFYFIFIYASFFLVSYF